MSVTMEEGFGLPAFLLERDKFEVCVLNPVSFFREGGGGSSPHVFQLPGVGRCDRPQDSEIHPKTLPNRGRLGRSRGLVGLCSQERGGGRGGRNPRYRVDKYQGISIIMGVSPFFRDCEVSGCFWPRRVESTFSLGFLFAALPHIPLDPPGEREYRYTARYAPTILFRLRPLICIMSLLGSNTLELPTWLVFLGRSSTLFSPTPSGLFVLPLLF
jgi:hypothetical protein